MGKLDTGSKKIVNIYNQAWAEWVLQQQQVKVEAELSGEFQFVTRTTDSLLQVNSVQGQFLVLTELQFQYDPKMPKRLTAYAALARQKYDLDVYVTVVHFLPPAKGVTIDKSYSREFMGQAAHQDFYSIVLWELEAEQILAYDNPAFCAVDAWREFGAGGSQMCRAHSPRAGTGGARDNFGCFCRVCIR